MMGIFDYGDLDAQEGYQDNSFQGPESMHNVGLARQPATEDILMQLLKAMQAPKKPTMPEPAEAIYEPGDVSGFAGAGMQNQQLPDPTNQIRGLMAMLGPPQQRTPRQPKPMGGLMQYLQDLSRR